MRVHEFEPGFGFLEFECTNQFHQLAGPELRWSVLFGRLAVGELCESFKVEFRAKCELFLGASNLNLIDSYRCSTCMLQSDAGFEAVFSRTNSFGGRCLGLVGLLGFCLEGLV